MRTRNKPKNKPPFSRKVNKYKIEALLHQFLAFEEDDNIEDDTTFEDCIEEETSILVNSETAKNTNPYDPRNFISTIHKNKPNPKTKANKASTSEK